MLQLTNSLFHHNNNVRANRDADKGKILIWRSFQLLINGTVFAIFFAFWLSPKRVFCIWQSEAHSYQILRKNMSEIVCIYFIVLPIFFKVSYVLIFAKKYQIWSSFILQICVCSRCRLWQFWVYASAYVRSDGDAILFCLLCVKSHWLAWRANLRPPIKEKTDIFVPSSNSQLSFDDPWKAFWTGVAHFKRPKP